MLAWDPELAALDANARLAVLSHDTEIIPADEEEESKKAAEFCQEMIDNIKNWEDIRYDMLDSPAKGMAVIQKNWVRDGSKFLVADGPNAPALQTLPQHWFYWKLIEGTPQLVYRGSYGGQKDQPLEKENFIIARHAYTVENPYGRGYLTEAWWTFVTKKIVKGFMIQLIQRGVEVERWAQCTNDENLTEQAWDQRDVIRAALEDFARYSDAVFPPGMELKYQAGDTGALQSELNVIHLFDNYLAKVVLGQTLTTDVGRTGSYGQALVHELQQARKVIAWCKDQDADITNQFLTPVCEYNFNVGRAIHKTKYEPEDDRKEQAERIEKLGNKFKLKIRSGWLHEAQGFEEPEDPDEFYISGSGGGEEEPSLDGEFNLPPRFVQKKKSLIAARIGTDALDKQIERHVRLAKGPVNKRLKQWKRLINSSTSYDDLWGRVMAREKEWPEFAHVLRGATMSTYAMGFALRTEGAIIPTGKDVDIWERVAAGFEKKISIGYEQFKALDMELRPKYFATAVAEDERMAAIIQSRMKAAIKGGRDFSVFKQGVYTDLAKAGYTFPAPHRLKTVFRYHQGVADAAAREAFYELPEVNAMIWGFEYSTAGDKDVRDSHASLHGTRLPKESVFWATNTPQIDFLCRCNKFEIMKDDAHKQKEPPEGWVDIPNRKYGFHKDPRELLRALPQQPLP
jgi:phage gp29-like protein